MNNINYDALIKTSADWLIEHPDARNIDVPIDLLDQWIFLANHDSESSDACIAIFLFGFTNLENIKLHESGRGSVYHPYREIFEYFNRWKFKLVMARLYHSADPGGIPMDLFKFSESEVGRDLFHDWSSN